MTFTVTPAPEASVAPLPEERTLAYRKIAVRLMDRTGSLSSGLYSVGLMELCAAVLVFIRIKRDVPRE